MKNIIVIVMVIFSAGRALAEEEKVVIGKAIVTTTHHVYGGQCEPLLTGYIKADITFNGKSIFSSTLLPGQLLGLTERQVTVFDGKNHHLFVDELGVVRAGDCLMFLPVEKAKPEYLAILNPEKCDV